MNVRTVIPGSLPPPCTPEKLVSPWNNQVEKEKEKKEVKMQKLEHMFVTGITVELNDQQTHPLVEQNYNSTATKQVKVIHFLNY